jgi:hypothetical protein
VGRGENLARQLPANATNTNITSKQEATTPLSICPPFG